MSAPERTTTPAPPDPAARLFDRSHRPLTIGVVLVMTMFAFEGVGVATAMPTAAAALHGLATYAWAFNGYLVASLLGMVLAGEWCDWRGPRQPLTAGVVLFAAGAALAGAAWSMPVLVVGRAVEGLGGGIGIVAVYVVLGRGYDDLLRPRAFALLSAAWVVPAIVGPFITGLLVDHLSWRWVFWFVVPFVLPPLLLLEPRLGSLGGGRDDAVPRRSRLLLAVLAGAALAAVQEAGSHRDALGVLLLVAGVGSLLAALHGLLPPGALRLRRGLPTVVLVRGALAGGFFGAEAFVPLALQTQRGVSITASGFILTAAALGWAGGSQVQGRAYQRLGPVRLLVLGATCTVVSVATLSLCLVPTLPAWTAGASWLVGSFGMGVGFGIVGNLTLSLSPAGDQGTNSAALQICDAVGSVVFIGLGGAIYAAAVATGTVSAATFTTIWAIMTVVLVGAVVLATRVLPRGYPAPTTTVV